MVWAVGVIEYTCECVMNSGVFGGKKKTKKRKTRSRWHFVGRKEGTNKSI